ncbi:MAG TPA: hypothetical protein PKD24_13275 [Pyrinomonadaceae bacterium]|nr:hypothetical protein [Pyrinomonadaceae bacterium]HMP66343.1 hypothetical protein [Pyrinomonadaceae bacterium]
MKLKKDPAAFLICLSVVCLSLSTTIFAQDPGATQKGLEATLYILIAGENPSNAKIPAKLDPVSKQVAKDHDARNLQLAATFSGRTSHGGSIEAKGMMQSISKGASAANVINWGIQSLRTDGESPIKPEASISAFRLNMLVPVSSPVLNEQTGKDQSTWSTVNLQLNISQLTLAMATPTMIGSVALSEPGRVMFVVLEVRESF